MTNSPLNAVLAFTLAVWGLLFASCNVDSIVEHRVDLKLPDSLSKDRGSYDSLVITFALPNGEDLGPVAFHGPFLAEGTDGILKDLLIGNTVPDEYKVIIKAYKGDKRAIYQISVVNKVSRGLKIVEPIKNGTDDSSNPETPPQPQSMLLSDTTLTLALSGLPRRIYATLQPYGATGLLRFSSDDSLIAAVDENGLVTPESLGETRVTVMVQGYSRIQAAVTVKIIDPPPISEVAFSRPAPVLYVGAPKQKLSVTHNPAGVIPVLEFASSDTGVISVTDGGEAYAKAEGSAILTVSALGSSGIRDTLVVRAQKDPPVIDAGASQSVAIGESVKIRVKVTQAFGTLSLNWYFNAGGFDAGGLPDGGTTSDTVTVTHAYSAKGDSIVTFVAKDGEGNTTTRTVRIRVGMAGPLINITRPRQDTVVNTPKFTVAYTWDGQAKTQGFTLREGLNVLTVKDSNAAGLDSASVKVTLDTLAPVVRILAPAKGIVTNLPEIDVAWTVDSVAQTGKNKESLVGKQGAVSIVREFTDPAGNQGRDSVSITRDTIPPVAPVFIGNDTATSSKKPTWAWQSGGGGNGTFTVQLGQDTARETTLKAFTPAVELGDADHTLRVRERDAAGNWSAWRSRTITIKTSGPHAPRFNDVLTTSSPTNIKRPTWAWEGDGANGGGAGLFKWSVNTPTPLSGEGVATSFTPADALADGAYTLSVQERDSLGNWSKPATREIRISTAGALVEITDPKRGTYTNRKDGVIAVTWTVNKAVQSTGRSDTLTAEGKWNRIRREFKDSAGTLTFDTVSVFWDTTAPKVAITSPRNGAMVNSLIVPVAWTVDNQPQTLRLTDTLAGADGPKTITRTVIDSAGNAGTATISVNLDRQAPAPPTVSGSPSSPTADRTPTWTWTGAGPFEYRYGTTNPPTANVTQTSASSFTPASDLAPGTWYFQVRERDSAMNWSAWSVVHAVAIYVPPDATMPAVRQHVRIINGAAFKYTSKLAKIIELNFTLGFSHSAGKAAITAALNRIAASYGTASLPLTVNHINGPGGGTASGIASFTISDLLSGEVIVANNVSELSSLPTKSVQQCDAIRTAIQAEGLGYLGIHGSGDNSSSAWPWFADTLFPVSYQGHGNPATAPVYRHLGQAKHLVLQGILETGTTTAANVPDELTSDGAEKFTDNVPVRQIKGEWHRWGSDLSREPATKDRAIPLLKYDTRNLSLADFPLQYRRTGGNIFSFIYAVGNGLTSFFPSGHDDSELLLGGTGFDGGVGDLDRYLAQLMFYLAGYNSSPCDASCNGLEIVDEKDHQLTGTRYGATGFQGGGGFKSEIQVYANQVAFTSARNTTYKAIVTDLSGQVVRRIESKGGGRHVIDAGPRPGVYVLQVTIGNQKPEIRRYAIL